MERHEEIPRAVDEAFDSYEERQGYDIVSLRTALTDAVPDDGTCPHPATDSIVSSVVEIAILWSASHLPNSSGIRVTRAWRRWTLGVVRAIRSDADLRARAAVLYVGGGMYDAGFGMFEAALLDILIARVPMPSAAELAKDAD